MSGAGSRARRPSGGPAACAVALLTAAVFGGCGAPSPTPAASASPGGRPALPEVPAAWATWIQANHFHIRSTSATDVGFEDLQFLKAVIGDRRLVQLGESGHGVAEFDSVKVRLVQFLHQQMGFDVIAFESGLYECFRADERTGELASDALMRHCIFGVWHADETLPLFDYIRATRGTARPLILAGFDTQFSTREASQGRPGDVRALLDVVDPALAQEAYALDTELLRIVSLGQDTARAELAGKVAAMSAGYQQIAAVIEREEPRLQRAFPSRPSFPKLMERAMRMAPSLVRSLAAPSLSEYGAIRDEGMADNVTWLARQLYPGRKILIWAHNYHVLHDPSEIPGSSANMGSHVVRRHRDELYTVGLYMYWGRAAQNNRVVYDIALPTRGSLEALFGRTSAPASFVDLLGQRSTSGTAWMFQQIPSKSWGTNLEHLTHRRQYDGILFVDEVHPPHYR